jgi:hypothetical protein
MRRVLTSLPWALLAAALLLPGSLPAQSVHVTARVDSNNILIGDWLPLRIEVEHPSGTTVTFPSLPDSLEGFEVVRRDAPIKKSAGGAVLESATFILTAFDSGMHVVPPFTVRYASAGDTTKHAMDTPPIPIVVHGVAVDTSKEIKDVKPPISLPITFADLLPYLIGAAVLGLLVWLYLYVRARRKKGVSLIPEAPPRPAHELALEALRALDSERMWQRGKVKEYHSQVADIVRLYIERRFAVDALESTTDEIMASGPIKTLPASGRDQLGELLTRADLVKFAKYQSSPDEHEKSMWLAVSFVESTRSRVAEPASNETPEEVNLPAA